MKRFVSKSLIKNLVVMSIFGACAFSPVIDTDTKTTIDQIVVVCQNDVTLPTDYINISTLSSGYYPDEPVDKIGNQ